MRAALLRVYQPGGSAGAFESVGSERLYSFAQRKSAAVVVKIKRNEI